MSLAQELAGVDATAQAELVERGEVTPHELVEAAITRIAAVDPRLNAVVTPMYEEARELALGDLPRGPFTGVPFLVKDLLAACRGARLTLGSRAFAGYVSEYDSELVLRLRRAGLVLLGKTNTPELGLVPTTEPALFGPCRNPWDPARTPGGSSGGSAAAVAAGMVPMAHGNDGGGSIRIPASCCGLFGLKPTRQRNPKGPLFGDVMGGLVEEHALTRSVRDSAALLDATSGPDVGAPYWPEPPERPFAAEVGGRCGRLRIAVTKGRGTDDTTHPDCVAAVEDAAALCSELGHEVVEASPSLGGDGMLAQAFTVVWSSSVVSTMAAAAALHGGHPERELFEPLTWALYELGRTFTGGDYLLAVQRLQGAARRLAAWQRSFDVWLTPTLAEPPLPLGALAQSEDDPMAAFERGARFAAYTAIANITGQPAMSVPLSWNGDGLPIGVQFVARYGDEATLFRLASQLEEARPWAGKHPPIWAGD